MRKKLPIGKERKFRRDRAGRQAVNVIAVTVLFLFIFLVKRNFLFLLSKLVVLVKVIIDFF